MKQKQIKIIQDDFNKIINVVESRMNSQIQKFAERLKTCKETNETIEHIENDYTQVVNFIDENPPINTLDKIADIEGFVNDAVEHINLTKAFKVHDLSISEKIRPLKAFLGYIIKPELPPKVIPKPEPNLSKTLGSSLSNKIMTALHKNRNHKVSEVAPPKAL